MFLRMVARESGLRLPRGARFSLMLRTVFEISRGIFGRVPVATFYFIFSFHVGLRSNAVRAQREVVGHRGFGTKGPVTTGMNGVHSCMTNQTCTCLACDLPHQVRLEKEEAVQTNT